MIKPYNRKKVLPKLQAERDRLERMSMSDLSEPVAKYVVAAYKKLDKAIELLEEENENPGK